jgi:hypothetical protein
MEFLSSELDCKKTGQRTGLPTYRRTRQRSRAANRTAGPRQAGKTQLRNCGTAGLLKDVAELDSRSESASFRVRRIRVRIGLVTMPENKLQAEDKF